MHRLAYPIVASALLLACDKSDKQNTTTTSATQTGSAATTTAKPEAVTTTTAMASATGSAAMAAKDEPKKGDPAVAFKGVGLETPESVLYDSASDVYLVSNVSGKPSEADGKAFISRLTPDGKVDNLKWIEGGKNKVTLNAPKGLAIVGDMLYVADLDTVRMFDRKTGAPSGEVKIPGATFLNDIASTPDGKVVVSDTGVKMSAKGMDPTGTDAVYSIDKAKKLTTIAKSKDLGQPNGVLATADKTWVVTMATNEIYPLDAKGKKGDATKLPKGQLDGVVALANGDILVSSWEGSAVYRGKPGGTFEPVLENVKAPADIGYDTKRSRLLVPMFNDNEVRAYDLK